MDKASCYYSHHYRQFLVVAVAVISFILVASMNEATADGILYPQASEKRHVNSLDGLWNFRAANQSKQQQGFDEQWFNRPLKQVQIFF